MTRSEQRQCIVALVYEKTFHPEEPVSELIDLAVEARQLKTDPFIVRAANGVYEHLEQIDELIGAHCIGWKLQRIPRVPLSILRVAVYELLFESEIPTGATINEAVELAKTYGGEKDASYINGVLGAIVREQKL